MQDGAQREAIVQEALRWQPPTALLPRRCSKDTELGGVKIRRDDWVLFGITAANSDPAVFADPRRFDPERPNKNLAFGHGEHFCLGSHLARRELETALERVLARFPRMHLAPGTPCASPAARCAARRSCGFACRPGLRQAGALAFGHEMPLEPVFLGPLGHR